MYRWWSDGNDATGSTLLAGRRPRAQSPKPECLVKANQSRSRRVILLAVTRIGRYLARLTPRPARVCAGGALAACLVAPLTAGQAPSVPSPRSPAAISIEQATTITQGWAYLAQGDIARAAERAAAAITSQPRSGTAFTLVLEVEIARAGALAALDAYENWIRARAEEPAMLRRIAEAVLEESGADARDPTARLEAIVALYDAGDPEARSQLASAVRDGSIAETRMLAARGDALAVRQLATALGRTLPNPVTTIQALGESGSRLAVQALVGRLSDPRPEVRGAAADALGRTGGSDTIPRLRSLLNDPSSHVRVKAASALFRLNDSAGLGLLEELATSESAAVRLVAAEAFSPRPDAAWEDLVSGLTRAGEPDVRLSAARLAARFDPALSAATLRSLTGDGNQAIREEASRILAAEAVDAGADLPALRALLRHPDGRTRVAAAGSIVRLTS